MMNKIGAFMGREGRRGRTLIAVAVGAFLALPRAQAGGLLVSDGSGVYRYNAFTGAFVNHFAPPTGGGMGSPTGLTLRPDGAIYLAALGDSSVRRHAGGTGAFLDAFVAPGSGGLSQPHGLAFGPDDNLYVCSTGNDAILRFNGATGAFMDTFVAAGSGTLSQPGALVFGPDGNLYVSSTGNDRVLRFDGATGAFIDRFVPTGTGGLSGARGIAFGPDGNLYVCSHDNNQVLRYNGATSAFMDAFVAPNSGGLSQPTGLVFSVGGQLFVGSAGAGGVLRYNGATGAFVDAFVAAGAGGLGQPDTLLFAPPTPPGNLTATFVSAGRVDLAWTDNSDDESAFALWRQTGAGAWTRIAVLPPNTTAYTDLAVGPSTGYHYRVRAVSASGASAWSAEVGGTTPPLAPAAPTGLGAAVISAGRVDLTWTDNSSNETAFAVWRRTGAGAWTRIAVLAPNTTAFSDTTVAPGTGYTYHVRSIGLGGASAWTNDVPVTTPSTAPAAPTGLTATVISAGQVDLTWTDNSTNETAFAVWRQTGAGAWTRIAVLAPNTTAFSDTTVAPSTTYTYHVRSVGLGGASAWTNDVPVTTPPPVPAAPTTLGATVISAGRIDLTWTDNSTNETAFAVWRQTGAGAWTRIAVLAPNTTAFSDTTVAASTGYTYRVRSVGLGGASAWTNTAGGTTP